MKYIVSFYVIWMFHTVIHEMGHYLMAKYVLKIPVFSVWIGKDFFCIEFGKYHISALPFGGMVEVRMADVQNKNFFLKFLFFEIGSLLNLITAIGAFAIIDSFIKYPTFIVGILLFLCNNLPLGRTDLMTFIKLLNINNFSRGNF